MDVPACVVGRLSGGAWIGFAPSLDDGYELVVGAADAAVRGEASPTDLIALAVMYFEERGDPPPEEVAPTHGDIAGIVRHAALRVSDPDARAPFDEAVDAIDDGLAADVVIERLGAALGGGRDALEHLDGRARELAGARARQSGTGSEGAP